MKTLMGYVTKLKKIPRAYLVGGAVVLLGVLWFTFFSGSSVVAQTIVVEKKALASEVSVAGTVVAAQSVELGFTQSGRLAGVYVHAGSSVGAGTTLAVTDNGDLRAALLQRQAALENQRARLSALQAGTRPEEVAVAQSAVTSDALSLITEIGIAQGTADTVVHNSLDQFINNPRTAPTLTFSTTDTNLKTAIENKRITVEAMLSSWGSEVAGLSVNADLGAAAAHAQASLATVASLFFDANAALNRAIPTTQYPQATIDTYISAVSTARGTLNTSISSLAAAIAELDASRKNLLLKQAGSTAQDIAAQQAQVRAAEADVAAAQSQINKTVISAPFSGTVTKVDAKVGQIVSPNTPLISMISGGTFQIESYIPEIAVASLAVGQHAVVYLDAYGRSAPFEATVVSIAPASEVREGVPTYKTVLQFSAVDPRIRSGMTADLSIVTQKKEDVIAVPLGAVVRKDGKTFVMVKAGKEQVEREVELGISSIGEVELLSGVSAGETVVLNPAL